MKKLILIISILGLYQPVQTEFSKTDMQVNGFLASMFMTAGVYTLSMSRNVSEKLIGIAEIVCSIWILAEPQIAEYLSKNSFFKQHVIEGQAQEYINNSYDIASIDTELYELFEYLKNERKIKEVVNFKLYTGDTWNDIYSAFYLIQDKSIYLNAKSIFFKPYLKQTSSGSYKFEEKDTNFFREMIFILRHELEHYCQYQKYPGSYTGDNPVLLEMHADLVSYMLCKCTACLDNWSNRRSDDMREKGYLGYSDTQRCAGHFDVLFLSTIRCDGCSKNSTNWKDFFSFSACEKELIETPIEKLLYPPVNG